MSTPTGTPDAAGLLVRIALTDEEILACHPVMAVLRPHLPIDRFVAMIRHLATTQRYRMAYLNDDDRADRAHVVAVAGFRIGEWLAGGRYLELEDFVTAEGERSKGHGRVLFDWLMRAAADANCSQLRLVSHVRRSDAHRFYLGRGMSIDAHYFAIGIPRDETGSSGP